MEGMTISGFRDLRVWQMAMDLVEQVYNFTGSFPRSEMYGLANQMRRASVSIPSNIAEGYARQHRKECLQRLSQAQASLAELDTQQEIATRVKYLTVEQAAHVREQIASLGKQLYALRRSLSPP